MLKIDICAYPELDAPDEPHSKCFHHFVIKRMGEGVSHNYEYKMVDEDGLTVLEGEYENTHPSLVKRVLRDCLKILDS